MRPFDNMDYCYATYFGQEHNMMIRGPEKQTLMTTMTTRRDDLVG